MALSPTKIAKLLAAGTPVKAHNGNGLYLDVRSATSASWLFKFTFGGKPDEVGLGSLKKVDLATAEGYADFCIAELAAGRNPKECWRKRKDAMKAIANAPKGETLHELVEANVAVITKGKLTTEKGRKAWTDSLSAARIGRIADMPPQDITETDVLAMLLVYHKRAPVQAEDVRERLAKVLGWAHATKRITGADWENPARWDGFLELHLVPATPTKYAALSYNKVGAFVADLRVRAENDRRLLLAIEWNIISATRAGEGRQADWSQIDWEHNCWNIPADVMKMRRPHRVPLTERHHEILEALLPADATEYPEAGSLFAVRGGDAPSMPGLRKIVLAINPDITMHGFRSSFGTWARAQMCEVALPTGETRKIRLYDEEMIEECLAHMVGGDVRNRYVRDDFLEQRRGIMEAWASYCGVVQEAKVVRLRRPLRKAA